MNNDQERWDEIVSGKRLPDPNNKLEQKAYHARQVLLWQSAKKADTLITPEQAQKYHAHSQRIYHKRQQRYWVKQVAKGVIAIALVFAIAYSVIKLMPLAPTSDIATITSEVSSITGPNLPVVFNNIPDLPIMVNLPSGSFIMGCRIGWDDSLGGCRDNEHPAHHVDVNAFALGKHEVTVGQFKRFVKETHYLTVAEKENRGCTIRDKTGNWLMSKAHNWKNPNFPQNDKHPVVCISWHDAQAYIAWLSQVTHKQYRLPSEEEWEYAARGGKITAFYWGSSPNRHFANYAGKDGADQWEYTSPAGELDVNDFGIHDILGNAWEIVGSCWRENYNLPCKNENTFTRRGGAWDNLPSNIRSSYRSTSHAKERSYLYGFRVAHD